MKKDYVRPYHHAMKNTPGMQRSKTHDVLKLAPFNEERMFPFGLSTSLTSISSGHSIMGNDLNVKSVNHEMAHKKAHSELSVVGGDLNTGLGRHKMTTSNMFASDEGHQGLRKKAVSFRKLKAITDIANPNENIIDSKFCDKVSKQSDEDDKISGCIHPETVLNYKLPRMSRYKANLPDVVTRAPRERPGHPHQFQTPYCSTNSYRDSFFPLAIVQWNALPSSVACRASLPLFQADLSSLS